MKKSTICLAFILSGALSGCQLLEESVDVASSTILASVEVDAMQTELGGYVDNQTALKELDDLQEDILSTLTTGKGVEYVLSYQSRSWDIYNKLKDEALSRWSELSVEQQQNLFDLDVQLVELDDAVNAMQESTGFTTEIVDLLYRATILMTYYKAI